MNNMENFLNKVKVNPEILTFQETIEVIESNYNFTPTTFKNGNQINNAGENNGSCKIFAFAKIHQLEKDQTLALFGSYYYDDVLKNPNGNDHQNIRNFMIFGWDGISFESNALESKF
ncbi:type III effector [Flavobacterium aquatile]|uniref:Type III effector n=2 Tax=Flavobacterium aquatile TaxID=245 RepID=A0A095SWS8_9FLAO|nr:type III effector [Flavobacterium aquatile LMG 4008 = ATCC 11947]OXA65817.1 type III effector [Flavobacterium aquatile] [Flavobacterium aquatile LMG 4008 = ATCC 11947]GEC78037.1 type III effector [Flavobacterium aquatile]